MKVGIDILEVNRVSENENLLNKIFTKNELNYIDRFADRHERIAGHFCAKEAIYKALGRPKINYKEIEISHDPNGRPIVTFYGETKDFFNKTYKNVDLSISHSRTIATAVCIVE
jgi:phosphopantetheine--protein transferase-like protein